MEMKTEDCKWYEYKCKSGETLFFYNTVTGEHRWPNQCNCSDTESNNSNTEACDPPIHQHNEQGMCVRSIGTQTVDRTAIEDVGMNTTSIGSLTDAPKSCNSTGTVTDINGVSDSRRLRALFNCALSVCNAEKVCRDDSVKLSLVAQTKGVDSGSYNICEVHHMKIQANQLDKARNEELNMPSLQQNVYQEQRPISFKVTTNMDEGASVIIVKKGQAEEQQMYPQNEIGEKVPNIVQCGFNYDEPVSNNINETELNNELLDGHLDTCVYGMSSGGTVGKKKSRNDLIERNQTEVVVTHCLGDDLETRSSERFDNRGERSGVTTICNSIKAESLNQMSAEWEGNNVTIGQLCALQDLAVKDKSVDHLTVEKVFPHELHNNPAVEVSLECEKLNSDSNKEGMLSSVTDPENAVSHIEDGISGEPCSTGNIQNQEQSMSTGEGRFKCTQSEKAFKLFRSNFVYHLQTQTEDTPYKCTHCDKAYKTRSNLVKHLRNHSGEKPYKCSHCDMTFNWRSPLAIHLRIHTGERPYQCTYCDTAFKRQSHLDRHLRGHAGEFPYKCNQCDKAFKSRRHLVTHLRIHSGERSHKCTQCDKAFKRRSHLVRHLRIHTGERPHKCTQCGKAFIRSYSLFTHLKIHKGKSM